jgi:hypothetical protein
MEHSSMMTGSAIRRDMGRKSSRSGFYAQDTSAISSTVYSLKRRSDGELGSDISSMIMSETHDSILDWIGVQRMSHLPAEGSTYDKVLLWAQLFVERLHSFEFAIEEFAGDVSLATQLAYGYCAILLKHVCGAYYGVQRPVWQDRRVHVAPPDAASRHGRRNSVRG